MIGGFGAPPGNTVSAISQGIQQLGTGYSPEEIQQLTTIGINVAQDLMGTPYQRLERAQADLQLAVMQGAPLAKVMDIQARLTAAQRAVAEYEATQQSRWEWSNLGKVFVGSGVLLMFALTWRALR